MSVIWEWTDSSSQQYKFHIGQNALRYDKTQPADVVHKLGKLPKNVTIQAENMSRSESDTEAAKLGTKTSFTMKDGTVITGLVAGHSEGPLKSTYPPTRTVSLTIVNPVVEA
jgi:hypothetical protein